MDDIESRGATLAVVGSGRPHQARAFRAELGMAAPVYADPHMKAYRAAGLRRDLRSTANLATVRHAARAWREGFRQGRTQGDPWQQGGVFVVQPGDRCVFEYVSQQAGDHPPVDAIVAALDATAETVDQTAAT